MSGFQVQRGVALPMLHAVRKPATRAPFRSIHLEREQIVAAHTVQLELNCAITPFSNSNVA